MVYYKSFKIDLDIDYTEIKLEDSYIVIECSMQDSKVKSYISKPINSDYIYIDYEYNKPVLKLELNATSKQKLLNSFSEYKTILFRKIVDTVRELKRLDLLFKRNTYE